MQDGRKQRLPVRTRAIARSQRRSPAQQTPAQAGGVTYADVVAAALRLPGVEAGTSYNTPALKVKGKLISRLRSEAEGALALRCDFLERELLLQADPQAFFLTDHYNGYPMILIRLQYLRRAALPDLLERAWRSVAPARMIRQLDAGANGAAAASPTTKR